MGRRQRRPCPAVRSAEERPAVARDAPSPGRRRRPTRPCRGRATVPAHRPRPWPRRALGRGERGAPGRRRGHGSGRWPFRRRWTSLNDSQSRSPSSAASEPPVATSTTARVPRRPRASSIASAHVVVTLRPDVVAEERHDAGRHRGHTIRGRRAILAGTSGRDPDVHGIRSGVRRDDRVDARSSRSPSRSATWDSPIPASRSVRLATSVPTARSPESWQTSSIHIGVISRGGPGSATIRPPSARSTHQPGAVPFGFASGDARRQQPGLLQVHLREGRSAPGPELAQPALERRVDGRRLADTRPRSPHGSGRPASDRGRRSRRPDRPDRPPSGTRPRRPARSSGRARIRRTATPSAVSRRARSPGVGVARLADRQLRPDAEELGGQDRAVGHLASLARAPVRRSRFPVVGPEPPIGGEYHRAGVTEPSRRARLVSRRRTLVPPMLRASRPTAEVGR